MGPGSAEQREERCTASGTRWSWRLDPELLQRLEHPLRRRHLDGERFSGLQQALQARQDRGPARTAAGEDVVADRPVVRLGQGQSHGGAGGLDLVGYQRRAELLDQSRPIDVEGNGQLARRVAFDHLATDVQRTIRRAHDVRAADSQIDLHRIAEKIFPAELRTRQCLPDLLGGRRDIDGVNDRRLEVLDLQWNPSIPSATGEIASAVPDSSRVLRPARIAGHPLEMPSRITLPSSKSSCVRVSFTSLPCGSRTKTTLVGRSLRAASLRTWWNVYDSRRGRSNSRISPTSVVVPSMTSANGEPIFHSDFTSVLNQ